MESIKIVKAKRPLVGNAQDNVLLKHLLTDHENFLLFGLDSLREPVENLLAAAAHGILSEPSVLVVLHWDVLVHDVGPLLQILQLVVVDLLLGLRPLV